MGETFGKLIHNITETFTTSIFIFHYGLFICMTSPFFLFSSNNDKLARCPREIVQVNFFK